MMVLSWPFGALEGGDQNQFRCRDLLHDTLYSQTRISVLILKKGKVSERKSHLTIALVYHIIWSLSSTPKIIFCILKNRFCSFELLETKFLNLILCRIRIELHELLRTTLNMFFNDSSSQILTRLMRSNCLLMSLNRSFYTSSTLGTHKCLHTLVLLSPCRSHANHLTLQSDDLQIQQSWD